MPKVTRLPVSYRARSADTATPVRLVVSLLKNLMDRHRQRRSLRRIPTELLNDVLPDGDTSTRERLRRAPKRMDIGLWY